MNIEQEGLSPELEGYYQKSAQKRASVVLCSGGYKRIYQTGDFFYEEVWDEKQLVWVLSTKIPL